MSDSIAPPRGINVLGSSRPWVGIVTALLILTSMGGVAAEAQDVDRINIRIEGGRGNALVQVLSGSTGRVVVTAQVSAPDAVIPIRASLPVHDLIVVVELPGAAPTVAGLASSERGLLATAYPMRVGRRLSWGQWTRIVKDHAGGLVDLVLPAVRTASGGYAVPAAPVLTGDPCDALTPGMPCETVECVALSEGAPPVMFAVGGVIRTGPLRGQRVERLRRDCSL